MNIRVVEIEMFDTLSTLYNRFKSAKLIFNKLEKCQIYLLPFYRLTLLRQGQGL